MFDNTKNTVDKGSIGLASAIFNYKKLGYNILLPLVDNQDYDLVIEKDSIFYTVQVKSTSQLSENKKDFVVGLKSIRPNRTKNVIKKLGRCDYIFVLCSNGNKYSIPYQAVLNKNNEPKTQIALSQYKKYLIDWEVRQI